MAKEHYRPTCRDILLVKEQWAQPGIDNKEDGARI